MEKHNIPRIEKDILVPYVGKRISCRTIAAKEGYSEHLVMESFIHHGLEIPRWKIDYKSLKWKTKLMEYALAGKCVSEIARIEDITRVSVSGYYRYHGIKPFVKKGVILPQCRRKPKEVNELQIIQWVENGMGYFEAANKLGISALRVKSICLKHGIKSFRHTSKEIIKNLDKEYLTALVDGGLCIQEIHLTTGINGSHIKKLLSKYGLKASTNWGWRNKGKNISAPADYFMNILKEAKLVFVNELRPLTGRKFRIDFAFPSVKLGLEINGNQHYVKGTNNTVLTPYHQKRHDLITAAGWTLIEIPCKKIWDSNYIAELLNTIKTKLGQ